MRFVGDGSGRAATSFGPSSSQLDGPKPLATEMEATSILPTLNIKTARLWRGIVPFTHLAREGRMTVTIGRRKLLAALGRAAAAWPRAARAQQAAMPVVAFVTPSERDSFPPRYVAAFRKGLSDTGYIEGQNVSVEYHWLE